MASPTSTYHPPGPTSGFVPEATDKLVVDYSRNTVDWPINRYMKLVPNMPTDGLYVEWNADELMRIPNLNDFLWNDGQEVPVNYNRSLRWKQFNPIRYAMGFTIGNITRRQAAVDVVAANAQGATHAMMTHRTRDAIATLTTSGNWPSSNTDANLDALGVSSGNWYSSSTTQQYIKHSFNLVKQNIGKVTAGAVKPNMLRCIVNPDAADQMGRTAEISAYLTQHEQAMANLAMRSPAAANMLDTWGLPPVLYGIEMVVEDTPYVSDRESQDDSATRAYAFPDDEAVFVARPGGLEGLAGAPNFATLCGFFVENGELGISTEEKDFDELLRGKVVDFRDVRITAGLSGYYLQDIST